MYFTNLPLYLGDKNFARKLGISMIRRMLAFDVNHTLFVIRFFVCFTAMLMLFASYTDLILLHLTDII